MICLTAGRFARPKRVSTFDLIVTVVRSKSRRPAVPDRFWTGPDRLSGLFFFSEFVFRAHVTTDRGGRGGLQSTYCGQDRGLWLAHNFQNRGCTTFRRLLTDITLALIVPPSPFPLSLSFLLHHPTVHILQLGEA